MPFATLLLNFVASTATLVPPDELTDNHAHPYHWGQPVIQRFERKPDDDERKLSWEAYVVELDGLWKTYRAAGSTRRAFDKYTEALGQAKRRYVYNDFYLKPVLPFSNETDDQRDPLTGSGGGRFGGR